MRNFRATALSSPLALAAMLFASGMAHAQQPFGVADAITEESLGEITGREGLDLVAQSQQVASVKDSSVNGQSTTGAVAIDGNAFQNLAGLSVVNANTGNNVAINASMNVNIALNPAP